MADNYSNLSNAKRAAKKFGVSFADVTFKRDADGRWTWEYLPTNETGDEVPAKDVNDDTTAEAGWTLTEGVVAAEPVAEKVEPEAVKIILPVPATAPNGRKERPMTATLIALLRRDGGASLMELIEVSGYKNAPWTNTIKAWAVRYGLEMTTKRDDNAMIWFALVEPKAA